MSALVSQLHFLRPLWLLALLLLPLIIWRWRVRRDAANPWRQVCDPHLLPHLLQAGGGKASRLPLILFLCGYALAVLALAGPAFRQLPQALARSESALVIALDLSDRMRAADLKPDRLSRARFKLADLLQARREGQTALIAYAGDAFTVAPLTDDAGSLMDLLVSLSPDTMPANGQRADRAIRLGLQLMQDGGFSEGEMLLVTDDVDDRALVAASEASAAGLSVSILGTGTTQGAPVARPEGGFLQDDAGNVLLPRLDEPALRALADAGGGRYATITTDARDLAALSLAGTRDRGAQMRADERTSADFRDEGPWMLLLLLPLAALAFRRGWLASLVLVAALPSSPAQAVDWGSLWKRDDQRAYEALQAQQPERALELAKDPELRGTAAYRSKDFEQAESAFAQSSAADALYNRGNALASAGRYEDAIAAYDEALAAEPGMEDAQVNRDAVQKFLEQQKQQQDQQQSQEDGEKQKSDPGEGDEQPPGSEEDSESESEPSDDAASKDGQPRKGERGEASESSADEAQDEAQKQQAQQQFAEQMEQALKEEGDDAQQEVAEPVDPRQAEKQQAVEQWLRRVPDDPGGLLRRKFALEHQRRVRERGTE
jgi:Ca-activated chloride channel family protein